VKLARLWIAALSCAAPVFLTPVAWAADPPPPDKDKDAEHAAASTKKFEPLKAEEKLTDGSVTVGGRKIDYQAAIGTLIVHPKGWDDVPQDPDAEKHGNADAAKNPTAEAAMSYVAYFAHGKPGQNRPVTFLFNGGPGSSTVWLHMGAFGPKRVVTPDDSHAPAAPYQFINNDSSLLDASDLVFIDAPGTGFGRIAGKDKEKAFYGVDADAYAFAEFITGFLSKYGRWNSPKYLFGESYGTTRSAVLINQLETRAFDRLQRRHPAVADPEFRPASTMRNSIPASTCPTCWRCRPMPRRPGITTSCRMPRQGSAHIPGRGRAFRGTGDYAFALAPARIWMPASARPSSRSCINIPACRKPTSTRPICASMAASSKRRCRTIPARRPAGSIRASPAPPSTR
jgi:hypothetical protein